MKTIAASPVMKNLAGATIATGTGLIMGCPVLAGALISLGVASSWLGGAGIIITAVGVGLWLLSTWMSTKQLDDDQSVPFHLVASTFDSAIGILSVIVSAIYNKTKACCSEDTYDQDNSSTWSSYRPDAACYGGVSPQCKDLSPPTAKRPTIKNSARPDSPGPTPDDDDWGSQSSPRSRSGSQDSQESSGASSRRSSVDSDVDAPQENPALQSTTQSAPTLETAPTMPTAPTMQAPPIVENGKN
jgi:hypothetical protein